MTVTKPIFCARCRKQLPRLPGATTTQATQCRDAIACERRRTALRLPPDQPQPPQGPCGADGQASQGAESSPSEIVELVAEDQRNLAIRALNVTHKIIDKMEEQLDNGVEIVLKDGTKVIQEVAPMALAAMARELRPIVQEPIRVAEAREGIAAPLNLQVTDPRVAVAVVNALRAHRIQRQADIAKAHLPAAVQTIEMPNAEE